LTLKAPFRVLRATFDNIAFPAPQLEKGIVYVVVVVVNVTSEQTSQGRREYFMGRLLLWDNIKVGTFCSIMRNSTWLNMPPSKHEQSRKKLANFIVLAGLVR